VGRFCSPRRGNESGHTVDEEALKVELDFDGELSGDPADDDMAQLGPETTMRPWSKERGREVSHACKGEEGRETEYFTVGVCSGGGGNRCGGAGGVGLGHARW
jgi:hypothetical protein